MMTRDLATIPMGASVRRTMTRMDELAAEAQQYAADSTERRAARDEATAILGALSPSELRAFEKAQHVRAIVDLRERVRDLEARLAERDAGLRSEGASLAALARAAEENGPPLMWRETWDATVHYIPGEVVQQSGALWVCKQRCAAVKPGTSRDSWKLIIKSADPRGWSRERAGAR
jgi:hypothetical protein